MNSKNVLTSINGSVLVSNEEKEDEEIFGENTVIVKFKHEFAHYHLNTAPIEKGAYLVVEDKIGDKNPMYEVNIRHLKTNECVCLKLYKLR